MRKLSNTLAEFSVTKIAHWCPACKQLHAIDILAPNAYTGAVWKWNHNPDCPTFTPSVNVNKGDCHYHITDGKIIYCADSKHRMAGMTVNLPNIPGDEFD